MQYLKYLLMVLILLVFVDNAKSQTDGVTRFKSTKVDFPGVLGDVIDFFGGDDPILEVETVSGNIRRIDLLDDDGQEVLNTAIVDLDKELFIDIDHDDEEYTVMTFAEWREMLKSGFGTMFGQPVQGKEKKSGKETKEIELKVDLSVDKTGETKNINGYKSEKIILSLKFEGEEKNPDSGEPGKGGFNMIATNWISDKLEGYEQFDDFNLRFAKKLGFDSEEGMSSMLTKLKESSPEMAEAFKKAKEEMSKMEGTAWEIHTVFESWGSSSKSEKKEKESGGFSFGGLVGSLFGGDEEDDEDSPNVLAETHIIIKKFEKKSLPADYFSAPDDYDKEETAYQKYMKDKDD